jgi:broad specificity phosphatase PhoE
VPPPLLPDFIKLRPRIWGFIARCTWYVGFSGNGESHNQAKIRAKAAADELVQAAELNGSVVLLAHGWFNRMMRPHLKAQGFSCVYDGGDMHWSYRKYVRKI